MAREFSSAGAHVVLTARDEQELERAAADIERQGGGVTTISCDVTDRDQIERTVQRIVHDRGGIDVLINNAGVITVGPLAEMTLADFKEAMRIQLLGGGVHDAGRPARDEGAEHRGKTSTSRPSVAESACRTCCRTAPASSP